MQWFGVVFIKIYILTEGILELQNVSKMFVFVKTLLRGLKY